MREFNFGQPDELQASQIEDQRRMLAGLMAQASQGPAFSGKAAAAKALTQILAQADIGRANEAQMALAQQRDARKQGGYEKLAGLLVDSQNPNRQAQAVELLKSGDPSLQQAAIGILSKGPGKLERVDLGDRIGLMNESGQITREIPKGISPDTRYGRETVSADTRLTHQTPSGSALLTDERTRAEGAANRGVTIRGQNMTDERSRDATAVTAGTKNREDIDQLRKEFDSAPNVKAYKEVRPIIESAKKAADTPQGDLSLVYAVGKVLDPGSVVREGEMTLVMKSGSLMERIMGGVRKNFGQGGITPEMRTKLIGMLEQRADEYRAGAEKDRDRIGGIAKQRGYDPAQIFGEESSGSGTARIQNDAEYAALPSGALFIGPDGKTRRKP